MIARSIARYGPEQFVVEHAPDPRVRGKTLAEAAKALGVDVVDAAIEIDLMGAQVTRFHMSEPDVEAILGYDFVAISTDGTLPYFGVDIPHPRDLSAPRYLELRDGIFEEIGLAHKV